MLADDELDSIESRLLCARAEQSETREGATEPYVSDVSALLAEVRALRDELRWRGQMNTALAEAHEAAVLDRARYRDGIEAHRDRKHAPLTTDHIDASDELLWSLLKTKP